MDSLISDILRDSGPRTVIEFGPGLDTRFNRLGHLAERWIEIDFPEVIALRERFFHADASRQMLSGSELFLQYIRRDLRESAVRSPLTRSPKAAVVLSLRGPDPCLTQTLEALLKLDYPDFHIQVVVDSELDPVLNDVFAVKEQGGVDQIRVSVLKQFRSSCSLKCSSLIQAVTDLPEDVEIVAFIDGDVVPHPAWLTELIQPLVQGEADVVGGNRWYQPPDAAWGSMTRYIWNAGFLRGMWTQGTPWAGTMAMRRSTIAEIGLLKAWGTAMSVDATLHRCMTSHHRKFKLAANLIMTNRESISLERFHGWVTRQTAVIRYTASETLMAIQIQIGVLRMLGIKEVDWRGIRYRLSTTGVQMQGYSPFGAKWIRQDNRSIV